MNTLYGIKNCDTIKKARLWLTTNNVDYRFHDYQTEGLSPELLRAWCKLWGWEKLINKRGTTWARLPDSAKVGLDEAKAQALMLKNTSLVKRPILDKAGKLLLGFDEQEYQAFFRR